MGISVIDLEPARDHPNQKYSIEPVGEADNSGVPLDQAPSLRAFSVILIGERRG